MSALVLFVANTSISVAIAHTKNLLTVSKTSLWKSPHTTLFDILNPVSGCMLCISYVHF